MRLTATGGPRQLAFKISPKDPCHTKLQLAETLADRFR
jgi:hypothetical protein